MLGGRSLETENKRICQISNSGLKSDRGRLKHLRSGRLRERFLTVFD